MRCLLDSMQDLACPGPWSPSYDNSPPLNRDVVGPRGQGIMVDRHRRRKTMEDAVLPSLLPPEDERRRARYQTNSPGCDLEPHVVVVVVPAQQPLLPNTPPTHASDSAVKAINAVMSIIHCLPGYALPPSAAAEMNGIMSEKYQDQDPNAALAQQLRGQLIHLDTTKSFQHWPMGARHAEYRRLQGETDRILELAVPDPVRCKKFKKSDFALFSSLWWPDADWEDLYTAMLFTVCLFVWDDIIDTNEHELASDYAAASVWREQSLAYFQYHLRLGPAGQGEPRCPDDVCLIFEEFGQRFCANFGDEQRRRMFSKIQNFVEHNELEQAERVAGRIPDYDSYMHIRYGVTGVRMFSLLLEIINQFKLPSSVMDSPEMESVIKECNFIIIVVNDVLSLKKEIATDCVVNAVPVLCKAWEGKSLQEVVAWLWDEMHASRDRLDESAAKLDTMTKHDPELNKNVLKFIDGIRIMDTGTLVYSIESPRYGIFKYLQPDGTLALVL